MIKYAATLVLAISFFAGCSQAPEMLGDSSKFSGKLSFADGSPVAGVVLQLQPLENGHPTMIEVGDDGTFSGEAHPGKYAYYIVKSSKAKTSDFSKVAPQFLEANMERTVVIGSGSSLEIKL